MSDNISNQVSLKEASAIDFPRRRRVRPRIPSATELLGMPMKRKKWVINGILQPGIHLLNAAPKSGKSRFALEMAVAVSSGIDFLDEYTVNQGPVVYVALEEDNSVFRSRLRALLKEIGIQDTDVSNLYPVTQSIEIDRSLYGLKAFIDGLSPSVVIVDTLACFFPNNNWRNYGTTYTLFEPYVKLAQESGIALVFVHHTPKTTAKNPVNSGLGTTALAAVSQSVLYLQKIQGTSRGELFITGKDSPDRNIHLESTKAGWIYAEDGFAAPMTTEQREIVHLLNQKKCVLTRRDIAKKLDKKEEVIYKLIRKLINKDIIEEVKKGDNGEIYYGLVQDD